jgi:hypothetical protein
VDRAAAEGALEREWWRYTLLVLRRPRAVFAALRDDSTEAADARQEPVTAIVFLGGIAAVLATGAASRLLDEPLYDPLLIAVWAVVAGAIYGIASYWVAGGAVHVGHRGAGGTGSYRQSRHLLAFAAVPLIVWLVTVWPVRLALYGEDLFRTGGRDGHAGRVVFDSIGGVFVAWCFGLLVLGIRTVYVWDWRRSVVAVSLAVTAIVALALAAVLAGG